MSHAILKATTSGPKYQRVIEQIRGKIPILLTCEHGGQDDFWLRRSVFQGQAARLKNTHWAYDPGAADLTRALSKATDSSAIICHVTRLFCDVNRPIGAATFARRSCDGIELEANANIDEKERRARAEKVWVPYHVRAAALADEIEAKVVSEVLSMRTSISNRRWN